MPEETKLKLARLNNGPEIFHSIQGEGVSAGTPSVFVRSSLCNLHCIWCDTDYTWNWKGTPWKHENDALPDYEKYEKSDHILELDIQDVADHVLKYGCQNIILTGGEPLLQQDAWCALVDRLTSHMPDCRFEVETNGTLKPNPEFSQRVHQYNVSPKLANSANPTELRDREQAMAFFSQSNKAWFKFVIADEKDIIEVEALIGKYTLPTSRILLMPEGRDPETLKKRRTQLVQICLEKGYRFNDRLHVHIWGAKRGV